MNLNSRIEKITENGIEYEVEFDEGHAVRWYRFGTRHREQGPAVERDNGTKFWYCNGKLHRDDGPAVEYSNGIHSWAWNDIGLTKEVQEQGIDQLSPEEIRFWLPILAAQKSK